LSLRNNQMWIEIFLHFVERFPASPAYQQQEINSLSALAYCKVRGQMRRRVI
jgi:hypothetical protein